MNTTLATPLEITVMLETVRDKIQALTDSLNEIEHDIDNSGLSEPEVMLFRVKLATLWRQLLAAAAKHKDEPSHD